MRIISMHYLDVSVFISTAPLHFPDLCGHLPAGCVLLSPCSFRSLCFPESVGARMGSWPSQSVIWHVYCEYIIILYNLQGTIMSAK